MEALNRERRHIFSFGSSSTTPVLRPPWAIDETDFQDACTRCGDCITACPTDILIHEGAQGYPTIDFNHGECTFCADCVTICPTLALNPLRPTPWAYQVQLNSQCLASQQVICTTCAEQCEAEAIRFRPQIGKVAEPEINTDACTGCGACVAPCPSQALEVIHL